MNIRKKVTQKPASSVFILDSDPGTLKSLKQLFERVGFHVSAFRQPDPLLEKMDDEKPQCIVAEARLANKDNGQLLADAHHKRPGLPIILLAWRSDISAAVRALKSGATDYLEKPVVDRLLLESVERAITEFDRSKSYL